MRTLGAKNEFVRSPARSTLDAKGRNQSRRTILGNGSFDNHGFSGTANGGSSSSFEDDTGPGMGSSREMQELQENIYSPGGSSRNRTTDRSSHPRGGHISQM